jgi:hypothetical protein
MLNVIATCEFVAFYTISLFNNDDKMKKDLIELLLKKKCFEKKTYS